MAKENLTPSRTAIPVPDTGSTVKDQKAYQQPEDYDARAVNAEFDRVYQRLNEITVEADALTDLAQTATLGETITRVNALAEILRSMGGLRRS